MLDNSKPGKSRRGTGRAYSESKIRGFRTDKHLSRRTRFEITQDLGDKERRFLWSLDPKVEPRQIDIPKKWTGKWIWIYQGRNLTIKQSLETGRVYLYWKGDYADELELHDLWNIAWRFLKATGQLREEIYRRDRNGKAYTRYYMRVNGEKMFLRKDRKRAKKRMRAKTALISSTKR